MSGLAKVARKMFLSSGSTISKAGMVTVIELVGACHWFET